MAEFPPQGQGIGKFLAGVSNLGNTSGSTRLVSKELVFAGGDNITLSQSVREGSATITISGATAAPGSFSAGVSNIGNRSGITGTVSGLLVLAGGNNITLSQSKNADSATVTISAFNQSLQPAVNLAAGTQTATSGTAILSNSNNISFGMNNNSIITANASFSQSVQPAINLAAGTQTATSGTVILSNSNSISFGMDNNSVITAEYQMQAHNSLYHSGTIGAESQIIFDTETGHDHNGSNSRLIIIPQYVEVAKSGKEFTSVKDAVDSITDADATKPYIIKVYPGVYTEVPFTMKAYVGIIGSSFYNTIIQTNNNNAHFITGTANSYMRNCAIVGPTDDNMAAIYYAGTGSSPFTIQDILIRKGYYGIWANSPATGNIHCINVTNWYSHPTAMHTFMLSTDHGVIVAMNSGFMCGAAGKITRGFACIGENAEIYLDLCYFRNAVPEPPTTIDGLFVDDGGHVKLVATTFTQGTNAIHIGPNGTGGYVIAVGCNIRNELPNYVFTNDILIDNFGTMQYTGSCTKSKLNISANANFSASFTDSTTGEEGTINVGELWLGFTIENSIPLRDYGLTSYSTGWRNGGDVTRVGAYPSLDISVAAGVGYINTYNTETDIGGMTRISWDTTPLTCLAGKTQWVFVDTSGTVQVNDAEPIYSSNILLAVIDASDVHVCLLSNHQILLPQTVPTLYEFLEEVVGTIPYEGCAVTQTAGVGNELKVDFAGGKYFSGLAEEQPAVSSPITFSYWYRKAASSGWICIRGNTEFNTAKYDDNSGTLADIPADKYKKDLLFVVKNAEGTEFHTVYGQELFDMQSQAAADNHYELPYVIDYTLRIAGIVVLANATQIAEITDERKEITNIHNELKMLQGGNVAAHQYYHLDLPDYTARNQKIVASISGNNTAGVIELISTGTIYLAGGNNVTLSQNANSVTISGADIAISAQNATTEATMFTFGNTDGLSFYINNGSIVGSLGDFITSQSNQALQAGNGSFTFQTATFGNSNGFSFYTQNGSMVGSFDAVKELNGSSGTMSISADASNNMAITNNDSTISVINLLSKTNTVYDVGSASSSGTGSSIFAMYDHVHAGIGALGVSNTGTTQAGATTGTRQGTFVVAASGNITASQSTAATAPGVNTIWLSVPAQSDQPRVVQLNGTSGNLSLSGASNITVSALNDSTITIYGPASILSSLGLSGNSTTDGSNGITGGGFVLAGGNSIQLSQSNNTISIHGSQTTQTQNLHGLVVSNSVSNPTVIGTSGSVSFAGTNVTITVAANNSILGFSVPDPAVAQESNWIHLIGNTNTDSNSTASGSTISWSGGDNIILAATNGNIVRIDANVSAGIGAIGVEGSTDTYNSGTVIFSGLTNITITTSIDGVSQYIQLQAPSPVGGDAVRAIQGSNGELTNSTVTFGNLNGLSFYTTDGSSFVGSYTVPIINGTSSTLTISAGNNISISNDASTINVINLLTSGGNIQPVSHSINAGTNNSLFAKDDHIHRGLAQFQISGTNTSNTSNIVYGSLVFAGGNSITLSQVSAPGGATVTISGPQFNNANNISFGSAAGIITATATLPSVGELNGSSGTMSISADASNNISISNTDSTISIINLLSKTNTVYDIGSASSSGTGSSIFAMYDHVHAGIGGLGVSNTGTTQAGATTGTRQGIFVVAASGNITASQSTAATAPGVNTIWLSVPAQTVQTQNLHALKVSANSAGNAATIGTSGTVSLVGTNITISVNTTDNSILRFSVAGIQGIAGSAASTVTAGTVEFQNANGITFGLNGNTMTASHNGLTSQSTAPSGLYATGIATTFTSGNIGFSGSNNITVSTAAQAIIISGPATHAVQTGISSVGVAGRTYTSGGVTLYASGLASLSSTTGQGIVISVPGVLSINGYSSTVTISAGNLISISNDANSIDIINLLSTATTVSEVTSTNVIGANVSRFALEGHQHAGVRCAGVSTGGNIAGTTAVLPGQIVFAGGNNITLSQSTSANRNMTVTISAAAIGAGSFTAGVSTGGNTQGTTGTVANRLILVGGNNITLSEARTGQYATVTIIGGQTANYWENLAAVNGTFNNAVDNNLSLQRIHIDKYVTATQFAIIANLQGTKAQSNSSTGTVDISFALYTVTGNTINRASSATTRISYTSGTQTSVSSQIVGQSGTRYRTASIASWNITPGDYMFGMIVQQTLGLAEGVSFNPQCKKFGSIDGIPGGGNFTNFFTDGIFISTTNAFPVSIHITRAIQSGASVGYQPWFMFAGA